MESVCIRIRRVWACMHRQLRYSFVFIICYFVCWIMSHLEYSRQTDFFLCSDNISEGENHIPAAGEAGGENPQHRGVLDQYAGAPEAIRRQLPHHIDRTVRYRLCRLLFSLLSADMVAAYRVHHTAADVSDCVSRVRQCPTLHCDARYLTLGSFAELFYSSVCSPGTTSEN